MLPDKLLINLKILSKIQKNGRITKSYNGIISLEGSSFYQSFKRFVTNNSRKQAIYEINSIISEAIDTFNTLLNCKYLNRNYSNTDEYIRICEDIELLLSEFVNAKNGIDNLYFTYQNDYNISSQIDIILLKINITTKDITNKLNYFKSFLQYLNDQNNEDYSDKNDSPFLENVDVI